MALETGIYTLFVTFLVLNYNLGLSEIELIILDEEMGYPTEIYLLYIFNDLLYSCLYSL